MQEKKVYSRTTIVIWAVILAAIVAFGVYHGARWLFPQFANLPQYVQISLSALVGVAYAIIRALQS